MTPRNTLNLINSKWLATAAAAGLMAALLPGCTCAQTDAWKGSPSIKTAPAAGGRMPTRWGSDISTTNPLPDYPRPQMARLRWQNLNGPWDYTLTDADNSTAPADYTGKIIVPYPYEAALSGVAKPSPTTQTLWYRRTFTVPEDWRTSGQRVLLHFGAVNWKSSVYVNGQQIGSHTGGYDGFDYDITEALMPGANSLVVSAQNPLKHDTPDSQILGKQRSNPGGVLYTGSTGIWQTVWIEPVASTHITDLVLTPDIDTSVLHITAGVNGDTGVIVHVVALDNGQEIGSATGVVNSELSLQIPHEHLWSPSDPHLYSLEITLLRDSTPVDNLTSYFGMRKISIGRDAQGINRILLNNQFVFEIGALDQGYWPDGEYTSPTDEALRYDIKEAKVLGFNLLRKHAKVEPDRWYYWADRLGMLVWQDMPQAFGDNLSDATKTQFNTELTHLIQDRRDHPSIIVWTLFNEGWGEHDTQQLSVYAHQLDPSRLINSASGGYNQAVDGKMSQYRLPTPAGYGDILDTHVYPDPSSEKPDTTRAAVVGEYGGVSMRVPGHLWTGDNFGYGTVLGDGWHLTQRYQQLLKEAYALKDNPGVSAVVYTQITDVEQETNGLLTYDRSVIKPLPEYIAAANRGQFPRLPPEPVSSDLVPTSQEHAQTWSYTTVKPTDDWTQTAFNASGWKSGPAPFGQGYPGVNTPWTDTPGDIWLRRTVTLPASIPAKLDVVTIHDEDVEVYINGVLAASAPGYVGDYIKLPVRDAARAASHPGQNIIAVHCHQTMGGQMVDVGIEKAN